MTGRICAVLAAICLGTSALSQTWQGLTLGAPIPDTTRADSIVPIEHSFIETPPGWEGTCLHTWLRPGDGTWAAVTRGCDGPVLRLYLDNGLFRPDQAPAFAGATFGQTTLGDIRTQFGSEGLRIAHVGDPTPALTYSLRYEVEGFDTALALTFNASDPEGYIDVAALPRDQAWLAAVELVSTSLPQPELQGATPIPSQGYQPIPNPFTR